MVLPFVPPALEPAGADVGLVRAVGHQLLGVSGEVDDLGSFAAGAQIATWQGEGAEAYRATVGPLARRADAASLALRALARRVDEHADVLELLDRGHRDLDDHRRHLVTRVADLRRRVATSPAPFAPELQAESDALAYGVRAWDAEATTWRLRLREEERAMVEALSRILTFDAVERTWGGVPDPADAALVAMPPPGSDPRTPHLWWLALTTAQQAALIVASPDLVGRLDGLPAVVRDQANRLAVERDLAELRHLASLGALTDVERRVLANAEAAELAVDHIAGTRDPVDGRPITAQVLLYDPRAFGGDGAIAVAAGDLDTADNVAVVVPGFSTTGQSADYHASRVLDLYYGARDLDPGHRDAVLFWIGYDAPDLDGGDLRDAVGVAGEGRATQGGALLAHAVGGLLAGRGDGAGAGPGDGVHLTVIGHSYGSTTMGHAAHDNGLGDGAGTTDLVAVGSPGLGGATHHAADLGVGADHVWDGTDSHDPVAYLADDGRFNLSLLHGAGLGRDPAEDTFGGHRFEAESVDRGRWPFAAADHSRYFDPDTESSADLAHIVNGQYDQVAAAPAVHDPWLGPPEDPERSRWPTRPWTGDPPLWN